MAHKPKRSPLPRVLTLLGIFLVLLYLYINLTQPPLAVKQIEPTGIKSVFSIYGWGKERFNSPNSVAAGPGGKIYVADSGNHRIAVFDEDGKFDFVIGGKAVKVKDQPKKGPLLFPLGLAVSPAGDIFVASMERSMVFMFDSRGRLRRQIAVDKPIDVTIRGNRVFVSTPGQVKVLTLAGVIQQEWGSKGRGVGSFEYPNGLAHDDAGNLFVSDTQNARIQILDRRGRVIGWAGEPPDSLNDTGRMFGLNMGVALDEKQRVFVVDAFRHSIHAFDHNGNKLGEFGEHGELEGSFNYPSGLEYLGNGKFAVADKWNDRVQIIRIDFPDSGRIDERLESIYPYVLLILLLLLLLFLYRRRRRLDRANGTGAGGGKPIY